MGNLFSFRLLRYPVHVHWTAVLLLLMIGFNSSAGQVDLAGLLMALLIAFVVMASVLVHELGHALAADRLGMRTLDIMLHGFGGLCRYQGHTSAKNRMLIALAGPAAGLLLGIGAGVAFFTVGDMLPPTARHLVWFLFVVNIFWTVFNLLPMYPLDGGSALRSGLATRMPARKAAEITRWVSLVVGGLVVLFGLRTGEYFLVIIAGLTIAQNLKKA